MHDLITEPIVGKRSGEIFPDNYKPHSRVCLKIKTYTSEIAPRPLAVPGMIRGGIH